MAQCKVLRWTETNLEKVIRMQVLCGGMKKAEMKHGEEKKKRK